MFVLRLLVPLVACYATDALAFDGEYFGHFSASFDAVETAESLAALPVALGGSLEWQPGDYIRVNAQALGLCPRGNTTFACH